MKNNLIKLKMFSATLLVAMIISSCSEKEFVAHEEEFEYELSTTELKAGKYAGNLKYVIADVQHGFLDKHINSDKEVNNLIKGLKKMQVNGVRLPIFAETAKDRYNKYYDNFYNQAKKNNLKIFATPVLHRGGKRIANGKQFFTEGDPPVKYDDKKTNKLINEIKAYANDYKCDWISPFCEDDRPNDIWTADQINKIFRELKNNLNGAQLVGPCTWGVEDGIKVLEKTNVLSYVSIVTTHNLGNQNGSWPKFIKKAGNKDVWDSECNLDSGDTKVSRLKAAIDNDVDGVVLYYVPIRAVNLKDGSLMKYANNTMKLYLKNNGGSGGSGGNNNTKYYYIQNKKTGKRLRPYNSNENALIVQAQGHRTGYMVQWQKINSSNGYFYLKNRQTGKYFAPATKRDWSNILQKNTSSNGTWTQWTTVNKGNGYFLLKNRGTGKWIRSRTFEDFDSTNDKNKMKIEQSTKRWTGDMEKFKFVKAN